MSKRYLLDTNILSDVIKNPDGPIAVRLSDSLGQSLCTSIIVAAELRFGAIRKGSARLETSVESILASIEIVPLSEPADLAYARLRTELERTGSLIGPNDLLIAAQALALDLTVVTDNDREFGRVPGLQVENRLRDTPDR